MQTRRTAIEIRHRFRIALWIGACWQLGCAFSEPLEPETASGQPAKQQILDDHRNWLPESASEFYWFHIGWAGDHTTYWSFACDTVDDCIAAVTHHVKREDLRSWQSPTMKILALGPAYYGEKWRTPLWDLRGIRNGLAYQWTRDDRFLDFFAIDLDTKRVYCSRWTGGFPKDELDGERERERERDGK